MGAIYKSGIRYAGGGSGEGGTTDYAQLSNKPTLNGITLIKGQTASDLGLSDGQSTYIDDNGAIAVGIISTEDIQALFN